MLQSSTTQIPPPALVSYRSDIRYIGPMAGRYALSERKHSAEERIPVYACRLCSISTRMAVVLAPVIGEVGETVAVHFDAFGLMRASVARRLPKGFAMELHLSDGDREKLAAKIAWQKKAVQTHAPDKREYKRILPRDPRTELTLFNGHCMACFVIDVSRSGAAISAAVRPKVGTPIVLGQLVGQVIRHLDVGFAVQFSEIQDMERLEMLMALPLRA
jgi:hypothetical protein